MSDHMLGKSPSHRGLFEAGNLCMHFVGRDTFYGFLALKGDRLFSDEQFACLYCPDNGQKSRPPGLRFGGRRVIALFVALTSFPHLLHGFRNRDLRAWVADLLGADPNAYSAGRMTYDLRRLRLKGIIFRPKGTNRHILTPYGWKVARLFARLEARVFRPAMAAFTDERTLWLAPLVAALKKVDAQLDALISDSIPALQRAA